MSDLENAERRLKLAEDLPDDSPSKNGIIDLWHKELKLERVCARRDDKRMAEIIKQNR